MIACSLVSKFLRAPLVPFVVFAAALRETHPYGGKSITPISTFNARGRYYTSTKTYDADTIRAALANAKAIQDALEAVSFFYGFAAALLSTGFGMEP